MIGLPNTTEFNKRIPKQKFYDHMTVSPQLKKLFVEQVKVIYWKHKLSPTTTNLSEGIYVSEIEVLEIRLHSPQVDSTLLQQIDREIPYHLLFLIEYNGRYQAWIGYKEASAGNFAFKVSRYYHTEWLAEEELSLKLEGITLDAVYENFVRQIAGTALTRKENGESLKQSVEQEIQKKILQKKIDALRRKIRREKQFNKQVEINGELKKLKKELEMMT